MKSWEIYWGDLTEEAQARMQEMYHENIDLTPIAIVDIEDEDEDEDEEGEYCGCGGCDVECNRSSGLESNNLSNLTNMNKEQKTMQTTEPAIAVDTVLAPVVWGVNKFGQEVKEHDKLSCGNGHDTWFTHVMFDTERNCWHREQDYWWLVLTMGANVCVCDQ